MKRLAALAALAACATLPALAGPNVGVSIGINQPGVFGRIDIGNYPQPALIYPQPVIITPAPVVVGRRPIYLYVPPGHQRNWGRYCGRYNACGQPVYFVQENWVRERYEHEHPGWHDGRRHGHDEDHDRGRDDEHGHGHGHGHGGKDDR